MPTGKAGLTLCEHFQSVIIVNNYGASCCPLKRGGIKGAGDGAAISWPAFDAAD